MNGIAYIRISTADQSKYSLDSQERLIREYFDRNGVTLKASFKDDGAHSDTFDRPDYNALEKFIRANKNIQFLVIFDHSRFSRNLAEALMKCAELQKKFGITVLTITDPIDTDFTDPTVFMLRAFQFMQAEAELHNIRKRTKSGMVQAALNGRHANMAPYGYTNARDAQHKPILLIDEAKALIVRFIFYEYARGADLEVVRRQAAELGYTQKGNSAVRRLLSNPVYAGLIKVPAHKGRKSLFAKGLQVSIISEQNFFLVQDRLNNKTITIQKREEVPLRGVLRCWCGRLATAGNSRSHTGKYYWYYLCSEHKTNLPARKLHHQFNELLDALSLSPERLQWLREKLSQEIGEQLQNRGDQIVACQASIKMTERQIVTTERKYLLKPDISESTFNQVIGELRGELAGYQRNLAALHTNGIAYWDRLSNLLPKLCRLRESYEGLDLEKKQQFIKIGFDNNLWYENGIYRTHGLHPLLAGNELELKEKGLLLIQKPLPILGQNPKSTRDGSPIELLAQLLELIA